MSDKHDTTSRPDPRKYPASEVLAGCPAGVMPDHLVEAITQLQIHRIELEMQNEALRDSEIALQDARDRYFQLFDLGPTAYMTTERDGTIVEANRTAAVLLGVERDDLIRRKISRFVASSHVHRFHRYLQRVVAEPARQTCEVHLERRDGRAFPARLESVQASGGGVDGGRIRMAIVDLTELQAARLEAQRGTAQLRLTQARLHNVVQSMMDSLVLLDPVGSIQDVNPATLSMLGYAESELIGRPFGDIVGDPEREEARHILNRLARDGVISRSENVYRARDGRRIPVLFSGSTVRNEYTGAIEAIACLAHDITDRMRREEQLRLLIEAAPVAMIVVDDRRRMILVNAEVEDLFGYDRAELLGKPVEMLVPEQLRAVHVRHASDLDATARRCVSGDEQVRGVHKDGSEVAVEIGLSPIRTREGIHVLAAIVDVSERKRLEEQARQSQKMEAIGTLASGVAHDFNNLLMAVSGCASVARDLLPSCSPAVLYLDEIIKSVNSGAGIARQLLTFTRKRERQSSVLELDALVAEREMMLRRLLREDIEIVLRLAAGDSRVRTDPAEMEQILLNLAVNASDAMPRGGRLTIASQRVTLPPDGDRSPPLPAGSYVVLSVSDTGCGMSDETRQRIFEPFFTTKEVGKGTGLGLATVYGIVQQVGGDIVVTSQEGRGTTFDIFIPQTATPLPRSRPPGEPRGARPGGATVLVVEDERLVRITIRHYLEHAGYHVLEAQDGAEAVERVREHTGSLDVLVTDMVLPGLGGDQIADEIRTLVPDIAVIFMSAHRAQWLTETGRLEMGVETLQKPFDRDQLLARVRRALAETPTGTAHAADTAATDGPPAGPADADTAATGGTPAGPADAAGIDAAGTAGTDGTADPDRANRSRTGNGTVLVVEDEAAARRAICYHLEEVGWKVVAAADSTHALSQCRNRGTDIDVLLTDYHLPVMNGDELARQVRRSFPDIAVVYMSGSEDVAVDPPGQILIKPLDLDVISQTVWTAASSIPRG